MKNRTVLERNTYKHFELSSNNSNLDKYFIRSSNEVEFFLRIDPEESTEQEPLFNFLKKKRKNSDLNLNSHSNLKNEKRQEFSMTPNTTDTKITSYFQQRKSSSYKKSPYKNDDFLSKPESEDDIGGRGYPTKCSDKIFKKLNFDEFENNLYNQGTKLEKIMKEQYNCASKNSQKETKLTDNNLSLKENINVIRPTSKQDKFKSPPPLSKKTISIIKSLKDKVFISKNLNLNLSNIIKKIKKFKKHPETLDKKTSQNKNSSTKYNSPKKMISSPKKESSLIKNANKIINSYSLKEKFEELLKRELVMPCHYKSLLKKFIYLDKIINLSKEIRKSTTLKEISNQMQIKFGTSITERDFQQMIFIVPNFYIYKWDINREENSNSLELFIDIPCDISSRIFKSYKSTTNFTELQTFPYTPIKLPLENSILDSRIFLFKKVLLHVTNEHHKNFLKTKGIKTCLNPFKHRTWHSEFDVHNVKEIPLFKLIEPAKVFDIN
jgi:hypothetical protein